MKMRKSLALTALTTVLLCAFSLTFFASAQETEGIYTYDVTSGEAVISKCDTSASGEIVIPDTLGGYPVVSIGSTAFSGCKNITDVIIPDSVTSIGNNAFSSCDNLMSIAIPNSVTSIGEYAFMHCNSLTQITIPSGVTSIGESALRYCAGLTSIEVAEENANYSSVDGALLNKDKTQLIQYPIGNARKEYTLPDSVISIGNYAFRDCYGLTDVTIGNNVTTVGSYAFHDCHNLTNVSIGSGVTNIEKIPFIYCTRLESIEVAENNPNYCSLDGALFDKNKTRLIQYPTKNERLEYTIPYGVTNIEDYSFYGCSLLTNIIIPDSVTTIGNVVFYDCSKLTKVTIGNSVTNIGYSAFDKCTGLKAITLPNSIENIGNCAFSGCLNLKSITIPENITTIGTAAFGYTSGNNLERTKIDGFKIYSYKNSAAETYANGNGFDFIDFELHEHSFSLTEVVTDPTLTKSGTGIYSCDCGSSYASQIPAKSNLSAEYEDGILSIYGSGDLPSSNSTQWHDWDEYREDVKTIIIDGEIGTIGSYSFESYPLLSCVIINTDSIIIEPQAFVNCKDLVNIIIFGNSEIDSASFVLSSPSLQIFKDSLCVHKPQDADTYYSTVNYSYNGSELRFSGDAKFTSYKFFDSMSAFCSKMSNIEKLKFTSISFDDMPIYYIPEGGASLKQFENNTLKNGEMYPLTQNHQTITFNALIDGIYDESIKHFYLVSTDESQSNVKDTEIKLADSIKEIVARALRWIVTLLNKLFALFKRFK